MAARYEISVNRVSDDSGMIQSQTVGLVSFPEDDPLTVTTINPLDYRTLISLQKYVEGEIATAQELAGA